MIKKLAKVLSWIFLFILACIVSSSIATVLSGCGHTVYHKVEGTGVYGRIPTPNGSSLVEVAIGDLAITSGMLRGGATYDENTSKGGTFGSVSMGRHVYLSTEPALNEGYIESVLTSKDTDPKTKQLIAEYLISRQQRQPQQSSTTSVNSATATGANPPISKPTRTGVDNVVDKAAEVAPKVVEPVTNATKSVVKDVTTTVTEVSGDWKTVILVICLIVVIILGIAGYFLIRYLKARQTVKVVQHIAKDITDSKPAETEVKP